MPDRLSDLIGTAREISALLADDAFHVLRQFDTTDHVGGSDYVIQRDAFILALGGYLLIDEITDPVSGEFDFAVPAGLNRLFGDGELRGTVVAASDIVLMLLNDGTGSYLTQDLSVSDGSGTVNATESTVGRVAVIPANNAAATLYGSFSFDISNCGGPNAKVVRTRYVSPLTTANIRQGGYGMLSPVTAEIDRIRIRTDNHSTDTLLGTMRLYGAL